MLWSPVVEEKSVCCLVLVVFILLDVSISGLIPVLEKDGFVLPERTEIKLFGRFGYSDVVL